MSHRTAAWYAKPSPTFVDAIALVRRHLWLASVFHMPSPWRVAIASESLDWNGRRHGVDGSVSNALESIAYQCNSSPATAPSRHPSGEKHKGIRGLFTTIPVTPQITRR